MYVHMCVCGWVGGRVCVLIGIQQFSVPCERNTNQDHKLCMYPSGILIVVRVTVFHLTSDLSTV